MWQEVTNFIGRIVGDNFQNLFEPQVGIHIVLFAGAEEGIEHGSPFGSFMGSGKEVVLPAQGIWTYRIFDGIIQTFG